MDLKVQQSKNLANWPAWWEEWYDAQCGGWPAEHNQHSKIANICSLVTSSIT